VELEFWERWLEARGGEWAEEYLLRTTRHPISPDIHPLAGEAPSGDLSSRRVLRVLDVGPGPLTHLGTEWEGGRLEVRLMDPASEAYARLLAKHGIDPPYPRDQVPMTRISQHYRAMPMSFDVIVLHNSLRKSPDPLRTVLQCASLLTPGGHVICGHDPTKALWHLENIKGSAILTYTNSWVNITDALQHFADVDIEASEQWVSLRIVRRDHS
jgi:SAM-dependent methyltransferase